MDNHRAFQVAIPLPCEFHRGNIPLALRQMRSLALWSTTRLSQVMSPTSSTISTLGGIQRHDASYLHDAELSDETIGMALFSPLFIQEREDAAGSLQAYHSFDEKFVAKSVLSVCHVRTGELSSLGSSSTEKPSRDSENEQIRILFGRQKEQILADCRAEIQKHEFQADYDRRNIKKLHEVIQSQRGEIYCAHQLLHEQTSEQNRDLREAHMKSLMRWKSLSEFKGQDLMDFREEN